MSEVRGQLKGGELKPPAQPESQLSTTIGVKA